MSDFMSSVSFEELYRDSAYYYDDAIIEKDIYAFVQKAIEIVLKYQVLTKEFNIEKEDLHKIIRTVYRWLLMDNLYNIYFLNIDYEELKNKKYYEKYHYHREKFWKKWVLLRNEFPSAWHEEQGVLMQLKKIYIYVVKNI
jgi:hypothetical protein